MLFRVRLINFFFTGVRLLKYTLGEIQNNLKLLCVCVLCLCVLYSVKGEILTEWRLIVKDRREWRGIYCGSISGEPE